MSTETKTNKGCYVKPSAEVWELKMTESLMLGSPVDVLLLEGVTRDDYGEAIPLTW